MTATVTAPSNGKPDDRIERTRNDLARAHAESDAAGKAEFEGLLDIAFKYQSAASTAVLAVSHAHGITDHIRQDTITEALTALDSAIRFLHLATSSLTTDVPF